VAFELMNQGGGLGWMPHVEDPTGGHYWDSSDPIFGDPLGPGESIAVAYQAAGQLKPHGFAAVT